MNFSDSTLQDSIRNFYAQQAQWIDAGEHTLWAQTFSEQGEFISPTYAAPAKGHAQLVQISQTFASQAAQRQERQRHIVHNLYIQSATPERAQTRAYLEITATSETSGEVKTLRIVTIEDQLECINGTWHVLRRTVTY